MSGEHKPTQNQRILDYIDRHGSITPLDAMLDLGIMRLASRVSDLKQLGYPVVSKFVAVENRHGEPCRVKSYTLMKEGEG